MTDRIGLKYDAGKPRMGLIPARAEELVAEVLTYGAQKYSENNWRYVDDADQRYLDAAMRHLNAYRRGEVNDSETNLPHLAHTVCCLMFMLELQNE